MKLDFKYSFINKKEINKYNHHIKKIHTHMISKDFIKNNHLGWMNYFNNYNTFEFNRLKEIASKIKSNCDVFLVVGIGGSYLGARACIDMLSHNFKRSIPIYFLGNNMNAEYINHLLEEIKDKDICVNVISKSGNTIEVAIAFRIIEDFMKSKYSEFELKHRIYITTDEYKGNLRRYANLKEYKTFTVPNDIGGRYSVLTNVGLFPIAVAGFDVDAILKGAYNAYIDYDNDDLMSNDCYKYAVIRNILYSRGKNIEALVSYDPRFMYFGEWFKQLFGESEGKEGKGIFPSYLTYTTDLHSMGQYIQEGRKNIFQTILNIENYNSDLIINYREDDMDGLNYISGQSISYINKKAFEGALKAHYDGRVSNIVINIDKMNDYNLGYLIYFFMKACAVSGYLLGVNPFNQPGVENYKQNMLNLLKDQN